MKEKIKWIILVISIMIFGIIACNIKLGTITYFDNAVYNAISNLMSPIVTNVVKIVTSLGGPVGLIVALILLSILIKNKKYVKYMWMNLILVFATNQTLKFIFGRERPDVNRLADESGFSFPSGHAMVSTAFYGFLIYWIYKEIKNIKLRNTLITLLTLLIITIGISRIYLGVHYASDVIGGILFAVAYLIVYIKIIRKRID